MIKEFKGKYSFLSNFYSGPVEFEGITYPTVEHAFQAAKTLDLEEREAIGAAPTPGDAKRRGRRVTLRPAWEECKYAVMSILISRKFRPGTELAKKLMNTEGEELQDGNTWGDTIWGVDINTRVGENMLGKILMDIRKDLFNIDHEGTDEIVCPWCGYEHGDSFEAPDECDEQKCDDCGKSFGHEREHVITYRTWKNGAKVSEAA